MIEPVSYRSRARLDLLEQFVWFGEHASVEIAERFFTAVDETCARLVHYPQSGVPHISGVGSLEGVRKSKVRGFPPFLIFYLPRAGGIDLIRVLHGARDLDAILAEAE